MWAPSFIALSVAAGHIRVLPRSSQCAALAAAGGDLDETVEGFICFG